LPFLGFHEAVGDVLALSVSTPKHLKAVGLIDDYVQDHSKLTHRVYTPSLHGEIAMGWAANLDKWNTSYSEWYPSMTWTENIMV